jgi:WhiB family redox-sensing transcriptional regulator
MNWRGMAACRDYDPEWWYPMPLDHATREKAAAVCAECPVTAQCREFADATGTTVGIWAGEDRFLATIARGHRKLQEVAG